MGTAATKGRQNVETEGTAAGGVLVFGGRGVLKSRWCREGIVGGEHHLVYGRLVWSKRLKKGGGK